MAAANLAYERGDETRLRALLEDWESSPESVEGEGIAADLIRTIRKIHQARRRLPLVEAEILDLKRSDLYLLRTAVEAAKASGRNLLEEMAQELDTEIARLSSVLQAVQVKDPS